jgi:hypothetical protein
MVARSAALFKGDRPAALKLPRNAAKLRRVAVSGQNREFRGGRALRFAPARF